ncbi:MAG: hypothetical protein SOZ07_07095, partial [Prevotella sp.]|nr:hypothetical protein [Prevotella sp.]MDD7274014.1 hypothetical protein [Prevotellaceae bacterium]MDY3936405.1 hypothetical protein [Prevotella sp.]MDY4217682.1 hypothetical protein [Prevotella sp.]
TACTCLSASSSSFSLEVARYVCDKTLNNLHRPSAAISLVSNDRIGFKNTFSRNTPVECVNPKAVEVMSEVGYILAYAQECRNLSKR